MVFIQEYSKELSDVTGRSLNDFLNGFGNLERSQSTEIWLTLFQFSRRVRRMTLKTTDLSVLLQWLVKLWTRLFCELLKSPEGQCRIQSELVQLHDRKPCLSNLISFHDKVTHLVNQWEPEHVIFLDFSTAFDAVFQSFPWKKLSCAQCNKCLRKWVSNRLMSWVQGLSVNGLAADCDLSLLGFHRALYLALCPSSSSSVMQDLKE